MISITEQRKQWCHDIINHYGLDNQIGQAQEECGELVVALNHLKRGRVGSKEEVVGEIADVEIMLEQLKYKLDITELTEIKTEEKIWRQLKRIRNEKGGVESGKEV